MLYIDITCLIDALLSHDQALSKKYVKLPKRGKIPKTSKVKSPTNLILCSLRSEFLQRNQIQDFFFLGGGGEEGGLESEG